jgi:hypothetical protein
MVGGIGLLSANAGLEGVEPALAMHDISIAGLE